MNILEKYLFFIFFNFDICDLWKKIIQENCCNIIISKRYHHDILLWTYGYPCHIRCSFWSRGPFPNKWEFFILIAGSLLFSNPETEFPSITTDNKTLWKWTDWRNRQLFRIGLIECIFILLLDFIESWLNLLDHQNFAFFSDYQNHLISIPCMVQVFKAFLQFLYFFQGFEGILLNFEDLQKAASTCTYQMRIARIDGYFFNFFDRKAAFSKGFIFRNINIDEFMVWFSN